MPEVLPDVEGFPDCGCGFQRHHQVILFRWLRGCRTATGLGRENKGSLDHSEDMHRKTIEFLAVHSNIVGAAERPEAGAAWYRRQPADEFRTFANVFDTGRPSEDARTLGSDRGSAAHEAVQPQPAMGQDRRARRIAQKHAGSAPGADMASDLTQGPISQASVNKPQQAVAENSGEPDQVIDRQGNLALEEGGAQMRAAVSEDLQPALAPESAIDEDVRRQPGDESSPRVRNQKQLGFLAGTRKLRELVPYQFAQPLRVDADRMVGVVLETQENGRTRVGSRRAEVRLDPAKQIRKGIETAGQAAMHKHHVEWLALGREPRVQLAEPSEKFGILEIPRRPA